MSVKVQVGSESVMIPDALLAEAIMGALPGFLTGATPTEGMQQAAIKSGVKALIPLLLGMLHKEIEVKHLPLTPPDLRCPAAKANIVTYTLAYLMSNAAILADQSIFVAEGVRDETGKLWVTRITPTAADAGASVTIPGSPHLLASAQSA